MQDTLNTNARAVLDVLRAAENHLTALDVYETVRTIRPRIGLATVYRILHQLTQQGLIKELGRGNECSRYDARTCRHDHAACTGCGALFDIPVEIVLPAEVLQAAARATGIELDFHEVRIYGRCERCRRRDSVHSVDNVDNGQLADQRLPFELPDAKRSRDRAALEARISRSNYR
jgi:Fur family peroxide stress response transcriptional regulator